MIEFFVFLWAPALPAAVGVGLVIVVTGLLVRAAEAILGRRGRRS